MERFKKTQIIAAIVTILLHLGVLLLLLNIYLKREIPQDEEGLEVMFGMSDNGGNDYFEPTPAEEIAEQLAEPTPPEQSVTPSDEAYQTQDIEESVQMKKEKTEEELKKEKELAEKRRIEKQKQLEEQRRIAEEKRKKDAEKRRQDSIRNAIAKRTNVFGNGGGGSGIENNTQGTGGNSSGSKGNPFGSNTSTNTEGNSGSGNNNSVSLAGRSVKGAIAMPSYSDQVEGKVIVSITVDKDGNVIEAHHVKGTTVDNASVINAAVAAAKKTKFTPSKDEKNQVGRITYDLQLK